MPRLALHLPVYGLPPCRLAAPCFVKMLGLAHLNETEPIELGRRMAVYHAGPMPARA